MPQQPGMPQQAPPPQQPGMPPAGGQPAQQQPAQQQPPQQQQQPAAPQGDVRETPGKAEREKPKPRTPVKPDANPDEIPLMDELPDVL